MAKVKDAPKAVVEAQEAVSAAQAIVDKLEQERDGIEARRAAMQTDVEKLDKKLVELYAAAARQPSAAMSAEAETAENEIARQKRELTGFASALQQIDQEYARANDVLQKAEEQCNAVMIADVAKKMGDVCDEADKAIADLVAVLQRLTAMNEEFPVSTYGIGDNTFSHPLASVGSADIAKAVAARLAAVNLVEPERDPYDNVMNIKPWRPPSLREALQLDTLSDRYQRKVSQKA